MQKKYIITDYGVKADIDTLQTKEIQAVIDLCRDSGGGVVVFPEGTYHVASLRMWSDMTLLFKNGSMLLGSLNCNDYVEADVPEGIELRTDMEMIKHYYKGVPIPNYRRAIISAIGEKNIAIIGEGNATIDGRDCFDENGEEQFRGPHGIFFSSCKNIELRGYTIQHTGNFAHQLDCCDNVHANGVTMNGGHDGIHLHYCTNMLVENCRFNTGDDCIAGVNAENIVIRNCEFCTSCQVFRFGGSHLLVENCNIFGPGYYSHRITRRKEKGKDEWLDRKEGRRNVICLFMHFSSKEFPHEPFCDIVFRNCTVDTVDTILCYTANTMPIQVGADLAELTFENVEFTNMKYASKPIASAENPLTVTLKNVTTDFGDGNAESLFDKESVNTTVVVC